MKTLLSILCISLGSTLLITAQPEAPGGQGASQTRLLQHLLEMDAAELAQLRQTIERIEKMSPEEKTFLRKRIGKLQGMQPERIEAMRERYQAIPEDTRKQMRDRWFQMQPEEREAWRQKLRNMSREERAKAFKEEGFLPPHNKRQNGPAPTREGGKKQP